jgi:hypothetical protein
MENKMKLFTLTITLFLGLTTSLLGQTVVGNGTQATWDYDTAAAGVETFRIYASRNPGVVPDGASYIGEVTFPSLVWTILTPQPGRWYIVVTASNATAGVESGPSNELEIIVIGKPTNLRIQP